MNPSNFQIGDCVFVKFVGKVGVIENIAAHGVARVVVSTRYTCWEHCSRLEKVTDMKLEHQTRVKVAGNDISVFLERFKCNYF